MPRDISDDADTDVPGDESASSGISKNATQDAANLLARLRGKDQAIDRLKKQIQKIQDQLDDKLSNDEDEKSTLRVKAQDFESKWKTLETEKANESKLRSVAEQERDRLKLEREAAKLVAEKFPALLPDHMIGDLKLPVDFASAEDYEKYLDRQAAKVAPPTPQSQAAAEPEKKQRTLRDTLRGATPSSSTRVTDPSNHKARPASEIADEMMRVEPGSPKYNELFQELNDATS